MSKEEFVTVVRHTIEQRIWHWGYFLVLGLLALTGIEMYFGISIFGGFSLARSWHMIFAFLAALWAYPAFVYLYGVTGGLKELLPAKADAAFLRQMAKNFLGLSPNYPEHSTYDVKANKYYRKHNPGEKIIQGGILALLFIQGLTGFAMFWPDSVLSLVTSILGNMAYVRTLHLVILYAILGLVAIHLYMALIPQNRETLKSMFIGKASERVHEST